MQRDLLLVQLEREKAMLDACAHEAASEIERLREVDPVPAPSLSFHLSFTLSFSPRGCRV